MQPINIIYVVDTATTSDDISSKMGKSYGRLFMVIGQQQLKPGRVMAIYRTSSAPWIFDVAVEVNKAPSQQTEGVQFKTTDGGDAIVLHYKGPYEQIGKAYEQLDEWLKKNNKQRSGAPMEVYLNEPAAVKDKNELLTDVYQLIK
jgi:effector-binding domain-containing protein